MKIMILGIGKGLLRGIYAFMKMRPMKRKVTILSRQSNGPTVDIALLVDYLKQNHPDLEIRVMCRRLEDGQGLSYGIHMLDQMWNMANSSVILLDSYCIAASILTHREHVEVIQMWHSMAAIKKFGYQTLDRPGGRSSQVAKALCMHRNYDHILCVSKATEEFYCRAFDTDPSKFVSLSLPRVDVITGREDCKIDLREKYGIEPGREVILYAPTFRKSRESGTTVNGEHGIVQLGACLNRENQTLVICPHPLDESRCFDVIREEENVIVDRDHEALYWLLECDRVITDYSAIAVEAAIANKPLYFYVYDIDDYILSEGINMDPRKEVPGITAEDGEGLRKLMEGDYDFDQLRHFRGRYFETDSTDCTAKLGEYINGLA